METDTLLYLTTQAGYKHYQEQREITEIANFTWKILSKQHTEAESEYGLLDSRSLCYTIFMWYLLIAKWQFLVDEWHISNILMT